MQQRITGWNVAWAAGAGLAPSLGIRAGSGSAFGLINQSQAPLPADDLANLRPGIGSSLGWSATSFVNTVSDTHAYFANVAELGLPNAAYNRVATNPPRTIGADMDYRF